MNWKLTRLIIGFAFLILGVVWSSLNDYLCTNVCKNCSFIELSPCFFLFLFVGIIFIVSGVSLLIEAKIEKKKK